MGLPLCGRYLVRYPDTQLVLAAGAPDATHILGPGYRDDPPEAPTVSEFDQQFLHRHAMAWSADHRPERQGAAMKRYHARTLAAIAAVGALGAATLIVAPARATPSTDTRRSRTAPVIAVAVLGQRARR